MCVFVCVCGGMWVCACVCGGLGVWLSGHEEMPVDAL